MHLLVFSQVEASRVDRLLAPPHATMSAWGFCRRGIGGVISTWALHHGSSPVLCAPKRQDLHRPLPQVGCGALAPRVPGMHPLCEPLRKRRRDSGPEARLEMPAHDSVVAPSASSLVRRSREASVNSGVSPSDSESLSERLLYGRTTARLCDLVGMSFFFGRG